MNITVKHLIEDYSEIYNNLGIKSISLPVVNMIKKESESAIFGTAFIICLNYECYKLGLFPVFVPKMANASASKSTQWKALELKINQKDELNSFDVLYLVNQEYLNRSGQPINMSSDDMMYVSEGEEQANMTHDMQIIKDGIDFFMTQTQYAKSITVNPSFTRRSLGIVGDGDIIVDDILFEIKCVKENKIMTKTLKQLYTYKYLNDWNQDQLYSINRFGYYNPLYQQFYVWNADIPAQLVKNLDQFTRTDER